MEIKVESEWTVGHLIDLERNRFLVVNHEYQRGLRWNDIQKRMFIDSIFRGYSIPAFYLHKKQTSTAGLQNTHFDIVDGQQRINAICSYSEGAFPLLDPSEDSGFRFPNFVKDVPCPWGGKRFADLPKELQEQLMAHKVVVYEIITNNESMIRDLFIRLQGGTPLTPQDKRDSWPGNFTEFVLKVGGKSGVDRWFGFSLFKDVAKVSNESRRRQLAAQVFMLFWTVRKENKFCDIKSANIDEFYHSQVDFDDESQDARRFEKICRTIEGALHGKPRIVGHYIIHLFLLVDSLVDDYAQGWESQLASKLFEFDKRRQKAADDTRNRRETEFELYYSEYAQLTQTRSDDANTIRRRHAFFSEEMLKLLSPRRLDSTRSFSELQRKTVFFRDMEVCQWCRMSGVTHRVSWDECEIHHVSPHGEGGATDVSNGALVHRECHPKNRIDVETFRDWWYESGRTDPSPPPTSGRRRRFPPPDGTKCRFEYRGQSHLGEIRGGRLALGSSGESKVCRSFSEASREVTDTARNGWRDWYLCLPGADTWLLADAWRKGG